MYLQMILRSRLAAGHSGQNNTHSRSEIKLSKIARYSASLEFFVDFVLPDLQEDMYHALGILGGQGGECLTVGSGTKRWSSQPWSPSPARTPMNAAPMIQPLLSVLSRSKRSHLCLIRGQECIGLLLV